MTFWERFTVGAVLAGVLVGYALLARAILTVTPAQARQIAEAEARFEAAR